PARFDALERGAVETGEGGDAERAPAVELAYELEARGEVGAGPLRLERGERTPLRRAPAGGDVLLGHAERGQLVLREVHAAEPPVLGDVAEDVDELERDPERLGAGCILTAVDGEARAAHGARDEPAVAAQVVVARVARLLQVPQAAVD